MLKKYVKSLMILKAFVLIVGLSSTGLVNAQSSCNATTNQCSGLISRVNVNGAGDVFIAMEGVNIPDEANCGPTSNFFRVGADSPTVTNYYAMALTAFASGSNIVIRAFADGSCNVRSMFVGE